MNIKRHSPNVLHFENLEPRRLLMCDGVVDAPTFLGGLLGRSPLFRDGAGNSMADAYDLGTLGEGRSLDGRVGGYDTADVFQFELDADAAVELALLDRFGNSEFTLLDATGSEVRANPIGDVFDLDAGTYFIEVTPTERFFSRYRLNISRQAASPTHSPSIPSSNPALVPPQPVQSPIPTPQPLADVGYFGGSNDWNLNAVGAPESWERGFTGDEITVAVIDTGVDTRHPDLNDNLWFNIGEVAGDGIDNDGNGFVDDVTGWNFVEDNGNVYDTEGHGTHVAGTIAAERNGFGATGVAYEANIMPIRALGDDGSGSTLDIAAGIRYAVDNGADIINMSLGGGYSSSIHSALRYAESQDVFVAIASGNSGLSTPAYPALHSASLDNVLSVGAHDSNGRSAGFSNDAGGGAIQVDAPGVSVYSTLPDNRYARYSGTSMAAPHVAGLAALTLSANPSLSASELRDLIVSGAQTDIVASASPGVDATYSVAYAAANYVSNDVASTVSPVEPSESNRLGATATNFVAAPVEAAPILTSVNVREVLASISESQSRLELARPATYEVASISEEVRVQEREVDEALADWWA